MSSPAPTPPPPSREEDPWSETTLRNTFRLTMIGGVLFITACYLIGFQS